MDMGLSIDNPSLGYELCGILEEKNGRSISGVIDEPDLVGVEYSGESGSIKSKIEVELLEFLYKKGVMTSFVETIDDDILIFEKSNKPNINIDFSYIYNKTDGFRFFYEMGGVNNKNGKDSVWHIVSKLAGPIKDFFDKIGVKVFSGELQLGFNNGQIVINGININNLKLCDHLVLKGKDGKSYIDGNYSEEELNGIGGKHGSYWVKLEQIPDDVLIEEIIAYKTFGEDRMEELLEKLDKQDTNLSIEKTTKRVQDIIFNHGPDWEYKD